MTPIRTFLLLAAALVAIEAGAEPVTPEASRVLDRWELELGGFALRINTELRFDGVGDRPGTVINFEDDLGYDKNEEVPKLAVSRHFGKRHRLEVSYWDVSRGAASQIESEIRWGEEVFPVAADVVGFYDAEFLNVDYTYWVRSREGSAWGPTFGLSSFDTGTGIALAGAGGA
ncbi:MAG: hypothetical protein R3190_05990, partial [Thermoanaerobaculia bacterium]|nr:hypothetical protein [Thermoanaerobaculia bacterium]